MQKEGNTTVNWLRPTKKKKGQIIINQTKKNSEKFNLDLRQKEKKFSNISKHKNELEQWLGIRKKNFVKKEKLENNEKSFFLISASIFGENLKDKQGRDLLLSFIIFFISFTSLLFLQPISAHISLNNFGDPNYYIKRQAGYLAIGIVLLILFSNIPITHFGRYSTLGMLFCIFLLGLILVPGFGQSVPSSFGKFSRWLKIGPIILQPSEFCKVALVCFVSTNIYTFLSKERSNLKLIKAIVLVSGMLIAILFQPQYGTTLCLISVIMLLVFVSGFPILRLVSFGLLSLPLLVILVFFWRYRLERLYVWLNPYQFRFEGGYQLVTSFRAFQDGGFFGKDLASGLGHRFLTYGHTDFAFALFAENFGWVGVCLLLLTFTFFTFRTYYILKKISNPFAFLLGSGALLMIITQSILNLFVVTGILPTTGVGLPFLSYGGSSLITTLSLCGILLNVTRYR